MIAVIFEVLPKEEKKDEYLNIAKMLRPDLDNIKGFISIERFQSLVDPKKILSLSFWENEESVMEWRNQTIHRNAQQMGKDSVFEDYRLRVTSVIRDYGMTERAQAPADNIF